MRRFLISAMLLFACLPAQAADMAKPNANLTILADESMLLPLAQIARAYATESHTPLTIVLKNADSAQRQIEQGLEAHVLISANYPLIDQITAQGLTDVSSRRPIARTQLALVSVSELDKQANFAKRISFASLVAATPSLPIYINEPATIEGARAAKLLSATEFTSTLSTRVEVLPNHDEIIAALHDEPSLALVMAAEAVAEPDVTVVSLLPDEASPPVTYDALVLGSELMNESRAFANYLSSRKARAVFAKFGYQAPSK